MDSDIPDTRRHSLPEDSHLTSADQAKSFLRSLLDKNLRVTTTDERLFWGQFKCTDPQSNIVLQNAYEYRQPSPQKRAEAAVAGAKVTVDMTSRFLGLVVVPGEHIVSMQLEEFASQLRR